MHSSGNDQNFAPYASRRQNNFTESKSSTELDGDDASLPHNVDVIVVGASWAGIWTLYRLLKLGLKVKMVEACGDVGGVWYYTRYPGCRVDTEVPLYEFSMKELYEGWNWSERFPSREEIHKYLVWVCDKLDLKKHIIFIKRVGKSLWDECTQTWNIYTTEGKHIVNAQFFAPCSGYSTIRYIPNFKGKENWKHKHAYHTSEWPENLDCRGKRVAVIGTAASGIQVIEALAPIVSHLTVFQRTPNLCTPMQQRTFTKEERDEHKKRYVNLFLKRVSHNGYFVGPPDKTTFEATPEEREAFWKECFATGGLNFWLANYRDMMTDSKANALAYAFWRDSVVSRIDDPIFAEKLAPKAAPHPFGAKRPSLETRYFECYNQSNVNLINVNEDPILEITPIGIRTKTGFHEVDIIAYATGFDFITGSMLAMGIKGVNGQSLSEKWNVRQSGTGIWTNLGLMTAGYPNMFFPMGPQAPSALGLTPQMAEIQGGWIADVIEMMRGKGLKTIQPTEEAEKAWKVEVNRASDASLLHVADSWYMGVNIPGRRKEPLCYFGGVDNYIHKIDAVAKGGYDGFVFSISRKSKNGDSPAEKPLSEFDD